MISICLAVHISDGILAWPWLLIGFLMAAILLSWSSRNIQPEEIPQIALLTAVFFVASLLHIRVGPTSVHLLLNSLIGIVLGRRAPVAIGTGLLLQALLLGHGGITVWGLNCCVMCLPALASSWLFWRLQASQDHPQWLTKEMVFALGILLHPWVLITFFVLWIGMERWQRGIDRESYLQMGWLIAFLAVMATSFLNSLVLVLAGIEDWQVIAGISFVAHIPLAVVEGLIVGTLLRVLAQSKPELFLALNR